MSSVNPADLHRRVNFPGDSLSSVRAGEGLSATARGLMLDVFREPDLSVDGVADDIRLRRVDSEDLIYAIRELAPTLSDRLARGILPLNAADLDGTLWKSDLSYHMLDVAVRDRFILPQVHQRLALLMKQFGLEITRVGSAVDNVNLDLDRLMKAFRAWNKTGPEPRELMLDTTAKVFQMCSWIYAGHRATDLADWVSSTIEKDNLRTKFFPGALRIIEELDQIGVKTAIFSASPEVLVRSMAPHLGVSPDLAFGMQSDIGPNGVLGLEVPGPIMFQEGKAQRVRDQLTAMLQAQRIELAPGVVPRALFSMGDSPGKTDEHLLQTSEITFVVNPARALHNSRTQRYIRDGHRTFVLQLST